MTTLNFGQVSNFVLLGGGQTLYAALQVLRARDIPVTVVTSARHASGRIRRGSTDTTLAALLEGERIPWTTSDDANRDPEVLDLIGSSTLGFSIGAEWIFRQPFIDRLGGRLVNLHGSRLPRMRGGGGFSWWILMGDAEGGSTIHTVTPKLDDGRVLLSREYEFPAECRIPRDYQDVVQRHNADLVQDFIERVLRREDFQSRVQEESISSYWPRLNTLEQGFIDWAWSLEDIDRFIRAFDEPYPGAATFVAGQRVHLRGSAVIRTEERFHPFQAGLVYRRGPEGMLVATRDGALVIRSVCDSSGRDVAAGIRLGDRFHTPRDVIDRAMASRATYVPRRIPGPGIR